MKELKGQFGKLIPESICEKVDFLIKKWAPVDKASDLEWDLFQLVSIIEKHCIQKGGDAKLDHLIKILQDMKEKGGK